MTGSIGESPERDRHVKRPFCRVGELADIASAIRAEDCRAVFLTSDSGLGASTILRKLAEEAGVHVPVLTVHGSQSLAKIPFGVLARYFGDLDTPSENFKVGVLRAMLAEIDRLKEGLEGTDPDSWGLPLIVIDDAHSIDEGTAELVVSLAMAGTANVVVSHSSRHKLPAPLPKLWATGMAENIVLLPLDQEQGHAYCEALLDGPVLRSTSWHYWSTAAGNPLFLNLLVREAVEQGLLSNRSGTWVGQHRPQGHSPDLEEAVRGMLRGLSREGKEALDLIALSEPLAETALLHLVPAAAVKELLDWPLISHRPPSSELLVLANPIYGRVVREMMPVTQSRLLHEKLIGSLEAGPANKESLLRRVLWAVEVGIEVPDDIMLRAAVLASKLFQSATSLELAGHIRGENFKLRATMVKARAKYNLGDYQGAFLLTELLRDHAANIGDLLFGSLLRAATRSALGMPVDTLLADARELRKAGEQLANADPQHADAILAHSRSGAMMVELMALSRAGRYSEMTALTTLLTAQQGLTSAADKLNLTMALTMDSERLTVQGLPEQGTRRAAEAFAIEHSEENDVFFLPESILLRQLTGMLCAGNWAAASDILDQHSVEAGPIVVTFGGGANVVRGMALLRAGQTSDALKILQAGLEPLQLSDPQQLLGYCTALASYSAARLGQAELAARLMSEYVEGTGMFVVVAHERAYLSAARQLLAPDDGGLGELFAQADAAHALGSAMLELNALVLAMELGEQSVVGRVAEVAAGVEGPWAQSIASYADALHRNDGHDLARAGELLTRAGMFGFAKLALAKSARLLGDSGARTQATRVRKDLRKIASGLGPDGGPGSNHTTALLTRREREVARLAASGMSDREIADRLTLAVRTVEGHLYRSYSKLGISTREELAEAL